MTINRLYFIDNLRIFLISLVVLHHLSITYGAPGDWSVFPPLKFIVLAPVSLIACFFVAWAVKQIPGVRKII